MLKEYKPDKSQEISYDKMELQDDMSYSEELLKILDHKESSLFEHHSNCESFVKKRVRWRNHLGGGTRYDKHVFGVISSLNFEDEIS